MTRHRLIRSLASLALLTTCVVGTWLWAGDEPPVDDPPTNRQLVKRLGSNDFRLRQSAARVLEDRGTAALPALRRGLEHDDPQVRQGAGEVIAAINWKVNPNELIRPSKVGVAVEGKPLAEVVDALARQAVMRVELDRKADWSRRKVTVSFKELSFWEALDQLCRTASVHFSVADGKLKIEDGAATAHPVVYAGGVRLSLLRDPEADQNRAYLLELLAEPRLPITAITGLRDVQGKDAAGKAFAGEAGRLPEKVKTDGHDTPTRLVIPLRLAAHEGKLAELKGVVVCSGQGTQAAYIVDLESPDAAKPKLSRDGRLRLHLVKLASLPDNTYHAVCFRVEGHPSVKSAWMPDGMRLFDDEGKPISRNGHLGEEKQDPLTKEWGFHANGMFQSPVAVKPRLFVYDLPWKVERLEIPFTFRNVAQR